MLHFKTSLKTRTTRMSKGRKILWLTFFWITLKLTHIPRTEIIQWHDGLRRVWVLKHFRIALSVTQEVSQFQNHLPGHAITTWKKPIKESEVWCSALEKWLCTSWQPYQHRPCLSVTQVFTSYHYRAVNEITDSISIQEWNNPLTFSPFQVQPEHGYFSLTCF